MRSQTRWTRTLAGLGLSLLAPTLWAQADRAYLRSSGDYYGHMYGPTDRYWTRHHGAYGEVRAPASKSQGETVYRYRNHGHRFQVGRYFPYREPGVREVPEDPPGVRYRNHGHRFQVGRYYPYLEPLEATPGGTSGRQVAGSGWPGNQGAHSHEWHRNLGVGGAPAPRPQGSPSGWRGASAPPPAPAAAPTSTSATRNKAEQDLRSYRDSVFAKEMDARLEGAPLWFGNRLEGRADYNPDEKVPGRVLVRKGTPREYWETRETESHDLAWVKKSPLHEHPHPWPPRDPRPLSAHWHDKGRLSKDQVEYYGRVDPKTGELVSAAISASSPSATQAPPSGAWMHSHGAPASPSASPGSRERFTRVNGIQVRRTWNETQPDLWPVQKGGPGHGPGTPEGPGGEYLHPRYRSFRSEHPGPIQQGGPGHGVAYAGQHSEGTLTLHHSQPSPSLEWKGGPQAGVSGFRTY